MSEIRPHLDREARRVHAHPRALDDVMRRAERRRAVRRVTSGIVALAVAGGSIGLAYAAFRPDREARPAGAPLPGPSTTPQATPTHWVGILVTNASSKEGAAELAAARLGAEGVPPDVVDVSDRPATGAAEGETAAGRTTIFCHPNVEDVARSLRDRLFPGAELQGRIDPETIVVSVGDDFVRRNESMLANFMTVRTFMSRRVQGSGAESFLSDDAARDYAEDPGLSLYGYAVGARFQITALHLGVDVSARAVVRIEAGATGYETLTVGDNDPEDGVPEILAAELNEAPAPVVGPAFDEVRAFVEGFLEARRERSGAGTYLGADARAAYASHEQGLDLLGYAAGPGSVDARIVTYDKLSPDRHRVVIRFGVVRPDTPVVWETLLIAWEGGDVFVVLDAERGRPD
jgi:hypothetical protein